MLCMPATEGIGKEGGHFFFSAYCCRQVGDPDPYGRGTAATEVLVANTVESAYWWIYLLCGFICAVPLCYILTLFDMI